MKYYLAILVDWENGSMSPLMGGMDELKIKRDAADWVAMNITCPEDGEAAERAVIVVESSAFWA